MGEVEGGLCAAFFLLAAPLAVLCCGRQCGAAMSRCAVSCLHS
jgi:hypothetical protein